MNLNKPVAKKKKKTDHEEIYVYGVNRREYIFTLSIKKFVLNGV